MENAARHLKKDNSMKANRHYFLGLICLGALTFFPSDSRSSPPDTSAKTEERYCWTNIGCGLSWVHGGLGGDAAGVSVGISMSYCKKSSLFSIRVVDNEEVKLNIWGNSGPPDKAWDIGVLYGRVKKVSYGLASISGGIGLVGLSHDETSSFLMGIPVEGQLFWTPDPFVGLGIYGFANLNSRKSFMGALLCLQIGMLR